MIEVSAHRYRTGVVAGWLREIQTETNVVHQILFHFADEDFLATYGIDFIAGQTFHPDAMNGDQAILTETAVKMLGWKDPIGKQLTNGAEKMTVVGVVKDFHTQSLHGKIGPVLIQNSKRAFWHLSVHVKGENLGETLALLEQSWKQFLPTQTFEFRFAEKAVNELYLEDQRVGQLVGMFAGLAIVVACLGLFGLAAFTAEQRTKEIGVRKVLGASVRSVVFLLSKEFAKLVLIANLIAWPVAYFVIGDWLQNFAYRVDLSWWVFVLGGLLALLIALLTVGYQAIRAALANPIEALRYE